MKKTRKLLIRVLALVLICAMMLPLAACRKEPAKEPDATVTPAQKLTYTVKVQSAGGLPLAGVGVYIYEDATKAELVWYDETDGSGTMTFTDAPSDTYVAVLSEVPDGFACKEFYAITGENTVITLSSGPVSGEDVENITYKLGDMVLDFTVTDLAGNTYTLSELLQQKKAVVLNFWYIQCAPCNAEFPYLQEAYLQYENDIALLALNPVNTEEEIAAFKEEKGYLFPMLNGGVDWQKLFDITAYPTTVIIDRNGNICLKHTGSIDNAKTFADAFAYFSAEDYVPGIVEDIASLEGTSVQGTPDKPYQMSGLTTMEITVEPGQEAYVELYRGRGMYLSVKGENRDFAVKVDKKTYNPESSASVGFVVDTGDNYSSLIFVISNTSNAPQKFRMNLSHLPGTFNNPYAMEPGQFTAKVSAGNEQGVYFKTKAAEDGTFIIQCVSAPAGVDYDFSLQSLDVNRTILRNYKGDGKTDPETGYPTVELAMKKGTEVLFSVGTLPDDTNSYPAGTFTFLLSFVAGELEEEEVVEKIDYTVTVTDELDQPLAGITVWLSLEQETHSAKTDENGVATLNLPKGTYAGTLSIPEGYTLEENAFTLTEESPAVTVKLKAAVDNRIAYTITVTDPDGNPVEGAEVLILGGESAISDAEGKIVMMLEPGGYTAMAGTLPAGFVSTEMLSLTAEAPEAALVLDYAPGTERNPIMLTELTNPVTNEGTVYYGAYHNGATMQICGPSGFSVLLNGQSKPSENGSFSCTVVSANPRMPMVFAIVGDGEFTVTFTYPAGHQMNPAQMVLGLNTATQAAGAPDYYYNWTAIGDGELTITMDTASDWVYCLSNVTTGLTGDFHWSDEDPAVVSQTLGVSAGDLVQVTVNTYDPADGFANPAGAVSFRAEFLWMIAEAPFTTAPIAPGSSNRYLVSGVHGATLTIQSPGAWVTYGGVTYTADAAGTVTVLMGAENPVSLEIGNNGTEETAFQVDFTWPEGSERNPKVLDFRNQSITTRLQAGDTDGYYYKLVADKTGTLKINRTTSSPASVVYSVSLSRNGEQTVTPEEGDTAKKLSIYVVPGDELVFHVRAELGADGTYPAVNVISIALFTEDRSNYKVTFDPNGGTLTGEEVLESVNGKLTTMPTNPVRDGWKFLGWFDAPEGGNPVNSGTAISANMTAYAQWLKIEYQITLNLNGGNLEGETTLTTTDMKLPQLPVPTLEGCTFLGWFDLPAGGNAITTDRVYSGNTTIYAQWVGDSAGSGETMLYEVTVIDGTGLPVSGDVYVTWQGAGTVQTKIINNASGTVSAQLPVGTYQIVLTFTGTYKSYRYDEASAAATPANPGISIQIAAPIKANSPETEYGTGSGDIVTKDVSLGATYVKLDSSQPNYVVFDGTAYCFFRLPITEEGKYGATTTNGAPISNWGTNVFFINNQTTEADKEANSFEISMKADNFGSEDHVQYLIFAVEVTGSHSGTILLLKDLGDVEYTYMDAPFVIFEGTQTPAVDFVDGSAVAIEENIFKLTIPAGQKITYVDMLNDLPVKGEDGFYHLGTEDGPILYVDLGENAPYLSLSVMIGAVGRFGTSFKNIFFNEDGTPEVNADGTYHKEDYTDALLAYCLHRDPETGLYPLTDDLVYMLQHGGKFKGWYTPGSGTYLLEEKEITVDPELLWMFAVCYLK